MAEKGQAELFHTGALTDGWRWFGAHPTERGGRAGWEFRVWAPRARGVSVVGDFNNWDASKHPLIRNGHQIGEPLIVHRGVKRRAAFRQAVEAMRRLDFLRPEHWARHYPHNLSGGMKQRALVAMGTIAGSRLLLADEPTKGLDEERRAEVEALFCGLESTTLLCVSHDLRFTRRIAHSVSVMYAGQLLETCSCEALFREPLHPYSQMLIASMPENGFHFPEGFAPSHRDYARLGCRFADRCPYAGPRCGNPPPVVQLSERQVQCWRYADRT